MRANQHRIFLRASALVGALAALVFLPVATAGAAVGATLALGYPKTPVSVGDTFTATLKITNTSNAPHDTHNVDVTSIFHTPSCAAGSGTCSSTDRGVFRLTNPSGAALTVCDGISFTLGAPDAITGEVRFIASAPIVLGPADFSGDATICQIQFNVEVLKLPALDSTPPDPPLTTNTLARATVTDEVTNQSQVVTQQAVDSTPGPVVSFNGSIAPPPVLTAPQAGWWWNPAESGRGFFIEIEGTQLFFAGYFYEADGRGTWLVSGGTIADVAHYTGRLLSVNGGQTLVGAYKAPAGAADVGGLTLHFTDATHGSLTWPGGTIAIQRQIFGSGNATFQPTGWWWNPAESGRGFSIEIQGDTLDVVGFMYDGNGNPVWYISAGKMSSPTHYSGRLDRIAGGQTLNGAYKPPTISTPVGAITIDFASLESGTITLSDIVPASPDAIKLKATVTVPIVPQLPKP